MSLYFDPTDNPRRPALVADLLGIPATTSLQQFENQTSAVLAWLVDRSPAVARVVLRLFLGERNLPQSQEVGAQIQVSLPKPDGGYLYPDLSICTSNHELQLLVEVKVDADLNIYPEFDEEEQPNVYRRLWALSDNGEARVRVVGTLTRTGFDTEPDPDAMVARDVTWRELREELGAMLEAGTVEPEVRLVLASFVDAIDARISPLPRSEDEDAEFLGANVDLLDRVTDTVEEAFGSAVTARRSGRGRAYISTRIATRDAEGIPLFLRLYLAAAGSRLSLHGAPDALIVGIERDPNGVLEPEAAVAVTAVGFENTKDLDSYRLHRRVYPLEEITDPAEVAADIVTRCRESGLWEAVGGESPE